MRERIVAVAISRFGMTFTLPPPNRHHDVLREMFQRFRIEQDSATEQGFITSEGRFVRRKLAARIARAARQIGRKKRTDPQDTLFSEDLW